MVASRSDSRPISLPSSSARLKVSMVASVVATRNGGLLSSANGVRAIRLNIKAGSDT